MNFAPRTRLLFACVVVLLCSVFASIALAAAKFSASLDKDTVALGESAELTLKIEGAVPRGQPPLPALNGITVTSQSQAQSMTVINGEMHQEISYHYTLMPTREGDITIPGLQIEVDGHKLSSQPLKLKVGKAVPLPTGENGTPQEAFVKLIIPKNEVYVGEVFPAEIRLYYQHARISALPQLTTEGFTIGTIPQNPEQTATQINGARYNVVIFRFPVTAIKAGTLTLGPATQPLTLMLGYRGVNFFGEPVFGESRQVNLASDTQSIVVHPLPKDNVPATFNGAIGQFTLHVEAGPNAVAVGDPITVKVQISGHGALDALTLPPQPSWREFKAYTPSSKIDVKDRLGLEGTKTFEQVVTPQNAGIKELPGFEFSFFDSEQKIYRTLNTPAIPLTVRPGGATPQPTVVSSAPASNENQPASKEIVHIKQQLGTLQTPRAPLIRQPVFLAVQALAPVLWLGSLLLRRQKENLANNPKLRRRIAVQRVVRDGLQQLSQYASANKSDEFFATTFRLLQEQLGERLDLPASAITEAVVNERLQPAGTKAETIKALQERFQACNQARYAPVRSSQQLSAFIPKIETTLLDLQNNR